MLSLLLTAKLVCAAPEIRNYTATWNRTDILNMQVAQSGCRRKYGPSHCLAIFIKEAPLTYVALCRKENKNA